MDFVQHINIKCTRQELEGTAEDHYGDTSGFSLQEKVTKQGKVLLQFTDEDSKSNGTDANFLMNYDKTNNTVEITPFKMASRNFVQNMSANIHQIFIYLAQRYSGDYVGVCNGVPEMIIGGHKKRAEFAVIEEGAKIPFSTTGEDIDGDDTSIPQIKIKKTIKEYMAENPDLMNSVKAMAYPDNLNYMAKYLIQKKIGNEIDFEEFLDLFRQCAILGANDPSVLKFYQVLKM